LAIIRRIELHLDHPFPGSRVLGDLLNDKSVEIGRQRVITMMRRMWFEVLYERPTPPKPRPTTISTRFPARPDGGSWEMDIAYISMARRLAYVAAVIDWFRRRLLAWRVSIEMTAGFFLEAVSRRWPGTTRRISSTPTKARSSPATP
jgi:putative transposase